MKDKKRKNFLLMPDSFKGTMDAITVCNIMEKSIRANNPNAKVKSIPVADGGEGTIDCFIKALSGEKRKVIVSGPFGEKIESYYGFFGEFAVVEMATAAGFMAGEKRRDPSIASTYGVGELIKHAINSGCKKIILSLGGSCTNDGGSGMAAALGAVFKDKEGKKFIPVGGNLSKIETIDLTDLKTLTKDIDVEAMCDIDNTLYGTKGAARVFAKQKGADEKMIEELDENLMAYAQVIKRLLGKDVSTVKGGGAAGGMGAGAVAFLNAKLRQGIDVVLDLVDFEKLAREYDVIFTGEGKLDKQSLGGKVVIGIARSAKKIEIPVIAVVGCLEGNEEEYLREGISQIFQTKSLDAKRQKKEDYEKDLKDTMKRIILEK